MPPLPSCGHYICCCLSSAAGSRCIDPCVVANALPFASGSRVLLLHHRRPSQLLRGVDDRRVYFVNSYRATPSESNSEWTLATSSYGGGDFVAAVGRGNVYATQFHPEKSGPAGLDILRNFLGPLDAEVPEPVSRSSECRPS